jgi:hypothetical protein
MPALGCSQVFVFADRREKKLYRFHSVPDLLAKTVERTAATADNTSVSWMHQIIEA